MSVVMEQLRIPLDELGQVLVPVRSSVRPVRTMRHWVWAVDGVVNDSMATLCNARVKRGWLPAESDTKFWCLECSRRRCQLLGLPIVSSI